MARAPLRPDHRGMEANRTARPWVHVVGGLVTVAAAVAALLYGVVVSFGTSYCDAPSASETRELRLSVFAIAVAFSAVPFLVGLVARNTGAAHRPWYGVTLAALALGAVLALTVQQSQWCF